MNSEDGGELLGSPCYMYPAGSSLGGCTLPIAWQGPGPPVPPSHQILAAAGGNQVLQAPARVKEHGWSGAPDVHFGNKEKEAANLCKAGNFTPTPPRGFRDAGLQMLMLARLEQIFLPRSCAHASRTT